MPTPPVAEPTSVAESEYVQLTADNVPIVFDASDSALQIAIGSNGDVFELGSESANWFGIIMFSGEERYVSKAHARIMPYSLSLPSYVERRKQIFQAYLEAEDRATAEADAQIDPDTKLFENIDYQRILNDRYKLDVAHRFNVPPISYRPIVVEAIKSGW